MSWMVRGGFVPFAAELDAVIRGGGAGAEAFD
jgi:hypothetical protein